MFLAMHGQPSDVDLILFHLALKLGKSLGEVGDLPATEIVQWQAYFKVKGVLDDMARRSGDAW